MSILAIPNLAAYDTLREAAAFSSRVNSKLEAILAQIQLPPDVLTVAVAGSLGRLESNRLSDIDYIVVTKSPLAEPEEVLKRINKAVREVGLRAASLDDRLAQPRTLPELLDHMGEAFEEPDLLRKRMLLLLEARAAWNPPGFAECLDRIIDRYSLGVTHHPEENHDYVLNDLARYYRHVHVRADQSWPVRDVKVEHSRAIMYAGLVALLGESSKQPGQEQLSWLREQLELTPLERLALVYQSNGDPNLPHLLSTYDLFLRRWSSPEVRTELSRLDDEVLAESPVNLEFSLTGDLLRRELARFLLARRGQWSDAFFANLLL